MAPSKRTRASAGGQSTLSFSRSKPQSQAQHQNKVTKSTTPSKADGAYVEKLEQAVNNDALVDNIALERNEHEPEADEEPEQEDADEVAARKVTDKQIKTYWADKEASRLAPRVHQSNLSLHEKCLREWDMQTKFGPSIGIQRLRRWKRARDLGMQPPIEVLAVLLKEESKASGKGQAQTSILDELSLSSKINGDAIAA